MEFRDVVRARRMIRRYRTDRIPGDALERILHATLRGPSAGFSQGIDVIVVTEPSLRKEVADATSGEPDPDDPLLDAPVLLVICADEDRYHRRYTEPDKLAVGGGREIGWPVPYWHIDAGAAMMLTLLAAVDEGLGAGVFGHPEHVPRLQRILAIPDGVVPIGVIGIGYSAEGPLSEERKERFRTRRRPLEDAVHRERW